MLLDEETQNAARELAATYACSVSEAIRRAVVSQRDVVLGVSVEQRRERRRALERAFQLFEGNDADAEVARLKDEDDGF